MRLDKYLALAGMGTRKEVKKLIRAGRVCVGGVTAADPGMKVSQEDEVTLDGKPLDVREHVYYMLNKPAGVISATEDPREKTVIDLVMETAEGVRRRDLFPVGRLDKDTEGLLLITNDGELSHRLLSPGKQVEKVYYARLDGPVGAREQILFREGLRVDETLTAMPAELQICGGKISDNSDSSGTISMIPVSGRAMTEAENGRRTITAVEESGGATSEAGKSSGAPSGTEVLVTIREGKYHQVKRMFAAVGREVLYLKRLSMGTLVLDPALEPGQWRLMTKKEVSDIISLTAGRG